MKLFEFQPKLFSCLKSYNKATFMSDLMAGIIVGIVALPLAIAFGIASGVTPEKGIITAIIAGLLISVFGGSKVQIGGPTGAFIVIVFGIIADYGMNGLIIATFMAGIFLILMGVLRVGTIIKYIPYPIIVGFTSGIALTIFTTQIKDLFGMQIADVPADFISKWVVYFQNLGTMNIWPLLIGICSILIIVYTPKISKKLPGSLVAIIVMTVVALLLKNYAGVTTIETIGDRFTIDPNMPKPEVPRITWEVFTKLMSPALVIAMLGAIESLLSAAVADGVIGDKHDSNQELVGQGIANMVCSLFGGIPATGAIARTMTNINNGGRTPIAGIIHAVVLLLILLILMPYAEYIPMASLAAVLVIVSYNMSGWRTLKSLMNNPKSDILVLLTTFFLTVIFDLTIAIEVGLITACALFMKRIMETTEISVINDEINPSDEMGLSHVHDTLAIPEGCAVYEINGPFFFGVANKFDELQANIGQEKPRVRIIRMRKVPFIDSTGIHNLTNLIRMNQEDGIHIILSGVSPKLHKQLEKARFYSLIAPDHICPHIDIALEKAREFLKITK